MEKQTLSYPIGEYQPAESIRPDRNKNGSMRWNTLRPN